MTRTCMKAIAVFPGKPNSVHLAQLPKPSVDDMPNGRGVLVKVLRVGVDGTDKEINAAEYGAAPSGYDFLIIGHESFGQVEAVGPEVTELQPGDYVVTTVRRPGSSIYDRRGDHLWPDAQTVSQLRSARGSRCPVRINAGHAHTRRVGVLWAVRSYL